MEILKHGRKITEISNTAEIITCPYCSCVFKAYPTDFLCERRPDGNKVIVCPDCHANIFSINNSLRQARFGDNINLDKVMTNEEKILKEILDTYETEYPTATGAFDEFVTKIIPNIFKNYTSKQKPKKIVYEDGYIQY